MGMFGRAVQKVKDHTNPAKGGLSVSERAAIFLAAMNGDMQTASALRQQPQVRAQEAAVQRAQAEAAGLFGPTPGAARQAPVTNAEGADISDAFAPFMEQAPGRQRSPLEIAQGLAGLTARTPGFNPKPFVDMAQYAKPDIAFDRGFGYDKATGQRAGGYHPELDKGQEPLFDASGRIVAVRNLDGSVKAAAEMAGAVEGAKARANAPYKLETVIGPDGAPQVVTNATAAALGSRGGLVARGQSPAAAAAERLKSEAQATAQVGLGQNMASATEALGLIQQMKGHRGLDARTGMTAALPAIPGTPGADFDAMSDQLRGKVFLEAFATLKGGGAITEREGQAAQDAIARLSQRQTKDGYLRALADLERVIKSGVERSQQKAGVRPAASVPPPRSAVEAELRRRGLLK